MYTCKPCTQVYTRGRCISSLCFFARMSAAVISPYLMDFVWGLLELNTWHQRAPMPAGWGSQHFMRHVSAHPVFPHNPLPLQQVKVQHLLGPENFCHPVVWGYVDKWSMISESLRFLTVAEYFNICDLYLKRWGWVTLENSRNLVLGILWYGVELLCSLLKAVSSHESQLWSINAFFSIKRVLLMHLLVNACVFVVKLVCRLLFTTFYVVFMAESRRSGIKQGELGPVL